jgi:hypothetical protein
MNEIPDFQRALSDFRRFLLDERHPEELIWVFRDDLWSRRRDLLLVRYPTPAENQHLAEKVYAEGRERGLVEVNAIAASSRHIFATVWFPKYPEEEVQGWSHGLKLTIRQPLPAAKEVSALKWLVVKRLSSYQRYQRDEFHVGIGTRRLASA